MRVNPNPMPDLLAALAQTERQQQTALLQMASGQRINQPSDDPAGAAVLTQILDRSSQADAYLSSIGDIRGQLQTADSTMSSVVQVLERAITLGTEGANGTLSDSDRQAAMIEVTGIRDQLISLANASYQGRFLFAGTAQVQPFVADATQTSGVRYDGNLGVNQVPIGNGYPLQVNVPGSQIFSGAGGDVFQSLQNLITGLQTNTAIDSAVGDVNKAFKYVTSQRVLYGNALNQLSSQESYLNNEKLQLAQQENSVAAADITAVASQLVNASYARQATLSAVGKSTQMSLFDYLG
jgi:flagellar hook-associated protein 3 FlgL